MASEAEIKKLAAAEVAKITEEEATKKAVALEVKRQIAANYMANRAENEKEEARMKKVLVKGIQQKHGQTMRLVNSRYGSESKPIFIDKGK